MIRDRISLCRTMSVIAVVSWLEFRCKRSGERLTQPDPVEPVCMINSYIYSVHSSGDRSSKDISCSLQGARPCRHHVLSGTWKRYWCISVCRQPYRCRCCSSGGIPNTDPSVRSGRQRNFPGRRASSGHSHPPHGCTGWPGSWWQETCANMVT